MTYDTIVIGAGQAGLAAGYHLARQGARFTILDAETRVGDVWRRRWDSLRLFTPARFNGLPGMPFPAPAGTLPGKDDVADYLEAYCRRFALPVQPDTRVLTVTHEPGRFHLNTTRGPLTAAGVIVATGAFQQPYRPAFAGELDPGVRQLHSSDYRHPAQVSAGPVLVVGAGNSGAQIAIELADRGPVWLSGPSTGTLPRRVLGRDVYDWLWPLLLARSTRSWIGRHVAGHRLFAGDPLVGIHEADLRRAGLTRVGRTVGVSGGLPRLDDGRVLQPATVIWCTGFRPDFSWIRPSITRPDGYPDHQGGLVPAVPGLAFMGLRYQRRLSSALIGGVGADAAAIVPAVLAPVRR